MVKLGVNIDHIATLREARKINEPDPIEAIFAVKNAGAHQITIHLREDRRHINDFDVRRIIESAPLPVNVESSTNSEIIDFLVAQKPHSVTLVPENRAEITTEGGLRLGENLRVVIEKLRESNIKVSLFIDAKIADINTAKSLGAEAIELHTGRFANLYLAKHTNLNRTPNRSEFTADSRHLAQDLSESLKDLRDSAIEAKKLGLEVFAGHGLNYQNVREILNISEITELNIGHSIVARAVFVGLERAIKEMLDLIRA